MTDLYPLEISETPSVAQAEHLGVSPAEVVGAIRDRGWLPDQIAALAVAEAGRLVGVPPLDDEIAAAIERIKAAPVRPIALSPREVRHDWRDPDYTIKARAKVRVA